MNKERGEVIDELDSLGERKDEDEVLSIKIPTGLKLPQRIRIPCS